MAAVVLLMQAATLFGKTPQSRWYYTDSLRCRDFSYRDGTRIFR